MKNDIGSNLLFIFVMLYVVAKIINEEYKDNAMLEKFKILIDKFATCFLVIGVVTKYIFNLW